MGTIIRVFLSVPIFVPLFLIKTWHEKSFGLWFVCSFSGLAWLGFYAPRLDKIVIQQILNKEKQLEQPSLSVLGGMGVRAFPSESQKKGPLCGPSSNVSERVLEGGRTSHIPESAIKPEG